MVNRGQEEEFFLKAIRESPEDPLPQLVYADWLDERGDGRGEIVRLVCEVRSYTVHDDCQSAYKRLKSIKDNTFRWSHLTRHQIQSYLLEELEFVFPHYQKMYPNDNSLLMSIKKEDTSSILRHQARYYIAKNSIGFEFRRFSLYKLLEYWLGFRD